MDYEKKIKNALNDKSVPFEVQAWLEKQFPELKESGDEQSKNWILEYLYDGLRKSDEQFKDHFKTAIAWLEKQGVKPDGWNDKDEEIRQELIEMIKEDWPGRSDVIAWIEKQKERNTNTHLPSFDEAQGTPIVKQGEQKPIIPKFRIGDIITPKDKNEHYTITDIVDEWYEFREKHINGGIPIHYQDAWQLVEQKPVEWSDEDEKMLERLIRYFEDEEYFSAEDDVAYSIWLKSLKDRVGCEVNCTTKQQWKPSDEMLEALYRVIPENVMEKSENEILLDKLYQGLKYGRVLSKE